MPVAAPPPPVAPPPPPIAPPPAPVVFTNRSAANSKQANKQATAESKRPMVTLQDIQNVRLRTVTTTEVHHASLLTHSYVACTEKSREGEIT